jgi:hypothetical protein
MVMLCNSEFQPRTDVASSRTPRLRSNLIPNPMPKAMVSMPQVWRIDDRNQCEPTHEVGARIVASFPIDFCPTKSSAQPQRDDELLG